MTQARPHAAPGERPERWPANGPRAGVALRRHATNQRNASAMTHPGPAADAGPCSRQAPRLQAAMSARAPRPAGGFVPGWAVPSCRLRSSERDDPACLTAPFATARPETATPAIRPHRPRLPAPTACPGQSGAADAVGSQRLWPGVTACHSFRSSGIHCNILEKQVMSIIVPRVCTRCRTTAQAGVGKELLTCASGYRVPDAGDPCTAGSVNFGRLKKNGVI